MRIAVDATPIVNGARAVKRNSHNVIEALLQGDPLNDYTVFYLDWHNQRRQCSSFPTAPSVRECRVAFPGRLLVSSWKHLGMPRAEWLLGKIDILYATDLYFPPSAKAVVLGTVRGIAYHVIPNIVDARETEILQRGLRYTLKHADYLLAVSQKTSEELVERLGIPEDRIFVVSHGIDPSFTPLADRCALGVRLKERFGLGSPYIFYVGVIGHHKNVLGLLQAYATILKRGHTNPLVLAGPPGSAWDDAHAFVANNGLEDHVYFLGSIGQADGELTDLYNGASLFVFPSFYEGWTAPPLEAMACGIPVITSNCSSIPETVGEAAILIDPHDTEDLASKMEQVLSQGACHQDLVNKGLKHVALHTWENAGKKLLRVFQDIHQKGPWLKRGK